VTQQGGREEKGWLLRGMEERVEGEEAEGEGGDALPKRMPSKKPFDCQQ
jgi:hypothetical protein